MFKKTVTVFFSVILSFFTFGCGSGEGRGIKIVATSFPCYDFARAVAGDYASVSMLIPAGSEVHSFEPDFTDIVNIESSDLFVYIGGENDEWVNDRLSDLGEGVKLKLIEKVDAVEESDENIAEGEHEHEHNDESEPEAELDEHIWTSLGNAAIMINAIKDELIKIDGANAKHYTANADSYIAEINKIKSDMQTLVLQADYDTVVVADRFPFYYLFSELGLKYYAAYPGCGTPDSETFTAYDTLINAVKDNNLPCVYCTEMSNKKIAETVQEEVKKSTGNDIGIYELHSCERISKDDFSNNVKYTDIMRDNLSALQKGLKKS